MEMIGHLLHPLLKTELIQVGAGVVVLVGIAIAAIEKQHILFSKQFSRKVFKGNACPLNLFTFALDVLAAFHGEGG